MAPRLLKDSCEDSQKNKKEEKKMRVFKTALGVLALTLGFGLSGSVKAESLPDKDIVEIAASAGYFKTLVAAVQAAGLVDTLKGKGPLTVFALTDEAFANLPAGTVENLLKPENKDKLTAVLTYHVVPGRVTAGEVVKLSSAPTVNGRAIRIHTPKNKKKGEKTPGGPTQIISPNKHNPLDASPTHPLSA